MRQLLGVVLAVAFAGSAYLLLRTSVAPPATATARVAPTIAITPRATSPALTAAPTQGARPTPAPFALTLSDADLTKAAASSFPQTMSGVTVRDPSVSVETIGVRLTATAQVFFGTTQFVMTATPVVTDGRITVRVDTATLAGLALPDSTRAAIADSVQSSIAKLIPANVRVTSVSFAPGRLTVQGTQP
jgi:hypothetical protein